MPAVQSCGAPPKCWWNYQTTSDHRNEFETQEMEISHCSYSGHGGSQGFLVIQNSQAQLGASGQGSQSVRAGFTLSSSDSHPFDQLAIYFLICRLALQAICRHCSSPGSRRRKIKYFTVGGLAIKLRAHEGGWGHSNPRPRHLKYFKTGADNSVKSSQYPHLSAQLFAPNIYWNICEVPRAVIPVQLTLARVKWPVMKWGMGGFSELELSL